MYSFNARTMGISISPQAANQWLKYRYTYYQQSQENGNHYEGNIRYLHIVKPNWYWFEQSSALLQGPSKTYINTKVKMRAEELGKKLREKNETIVGKEIIQTPN